MNKKCCGVDKERRPVENKGDRIVKEYRTQKSGLRGQNNSNIKNVNGRSFWRKILKANWLSSCVKKQPGVREALSDLADNIRDYEDAAKPSACRETGGSFWSPELMLFRPDWRIFILISVVYGITGIIFSWLVSDYPSDKWADLLGKWTDLALRITVPVFVLGISLVTLARAIGESRRFAGEYLNDSCRTPWFCCLTLIAILCGVVGHFVSTVEDVPNIVFVGIGMASIGAAIDCLAMLAFVIREMIRCSVSSESVIVVSRYAARKLTWGYLKEVYLTLFQSQQKDFLEKWCAGKAIYPPSKYYGHYFKSNLHQENKDDVEIELDGYKLEEGEYKDYNLKKLARLDAYLRGNNAELYLSSPLYESERKELGILNCKNLKQNQQMQSIVKGKGRKAIKWKKYKFSEEQAEFWERHLSALETALSVAIQNGEPNQVRRYLNVALNSLSILRILKKHKIIDDSNNNVRWRSYEFIRFYLKAIKIIMEIRDSDHIYDLSREVRHSIWEGTKNVLHDMDYRTMELYTWVAQQIYTLIQDADGKGNKLQNMRAQFGGFYEFAGGWLGDSKSKNDAEDVKKMQIVLHEGLTKWLLMTIEKKDSELTEQLCVAAREITFGREAIKFENIEVVAQHLMLAGYLISLIKSKAISTTAIEKLFCERYSHEPDINFEGLVKFYFDVSLSLEKTNQYTRLLYPLKKTFTNLFTGSSHSSGSGSMGSNEISLAFIFLAAHAFKMPELPKPNAKMARRITKENIKIVKESFDEPYFDYGVKRFEEWIQSCDELQEAEEAKEIADATIDEAKAKEHEKTFWEGYSKALPVLSMCLRNGNCEIDNNVKNEWGYHVPKIALYNYKYPISGAEGNEYGSSIGRKMESYVLEAIIKSCKIESEIKGGVPEAISEAAKWLDNEGCITSNGAINNKGFVVTISKQLPEVKMFKNKDFVPSWREDVKSMGFNGFYRGYPIKRFQKIEEEEGKIEKDEAKDKKPQCEMVIAVDIRGWLGFQVRKEVVTEQRYGELKIRTWTDEEIDQAIKSGELDAKNTDKAKGNCPVDVTFFWEHIKDRLPKTRAFKLIE